MKSLPQKAESLEKGRGEENVLEALRVNGEFKIKLNGKVTVEAEEQPREPVPSS